MVRAMAAARRPANDGPAGTSMVSEGIAPLLVPRTVTRQAPLGCGGLRRAREVLARGRRDGRRSQLDDDVGARGVGLGARVHVDLVRQPVGLAAVARGAGGDDVVPA